MSLNLPFLGSQSGVKIPTCGCSREQGQGLQEMFPTSREIDAGKAAKEVPSFHHQLAPILLSKRSNTTMSAGEDSHIMRLQSALRAFQSSSRTFQLLKTTSKPTPPRKCTTLVVLDSSFNPPTIAHRHMAMTALHDLQNQRGLSTSTNDNAGIRLLLLLAVNNADKPPKPASFEHRLLLMEHFAADIQREWREIHTEDKRSSGVVVPPVDIGLTKHPYFHDKSAAIAEANTEYAFEPVDAGSEQIFLAGYDTLIRIFNPKYYTEAADGVATPIQAALDPFLARARLRITMRTDGEWGDDDAQGEYFEGLLSGQELEKVGGRREWARKIEMVEALQGKDGLVLSSTEARVAIEKKDWALLKLLVPEGVAGVIERREVSW